MGRSDPHTAKHCSPVLINVVSLGRVSIWQRPSSPNLIMPKSDDSIQGYDMRELFLVEAKMFLDLENGRLSLIQEPITSSQGPACHVSHAQETFLHAVVYTY